MKAICVYCGSSLGRTQDYADGARVLAQALVRRNLQLVYGGASLGIMGLLADTVLELGGQAIGVIPESLLKKEVAHHGLTELHVTQSMHERKTLMAELSDGFVALPGGIGTLEEIFEIWTWAQLGFHQKPVGLLNIAGYFDSLIKLIDGSVEAGFVQPVHRQMFAVEVEPEVLLERYAKYQAPQGSKWR
jgi:hypothetical protein